LFLNGQDLGSRDVARNGHVEWSVPFAPGVLEARGFRNGRQILISRRETVGPPAAIMLKPDRASLAADGEDVAVIAVEVVDSQGRTVPTAGDAIAFTIAGSGELIGVGNGNPASHEPDKAFQRRAFNGLCQAIVQASKAAGPIRVDAIAPGLSAASITINAVPCTPRPSVN
jgi:beta-galactosidase